MKFYYKDIIIKLSFIMIGTIESFPRLKKQFINSIKIPYQPNLLHGDLVEFIDNKVKLLERKTKFITGILKLKEKKHIKVHKKRGFFFKPFQAYDPHFPSMFVSTRVDKASQDTYVVIEVMDYDPSMKQFRGQTHVKIGEAGNLEAEIEYLRYRNQLRINHSKTKTNAILKEFEKEDDPYKDIRVDRTKEDIFSIDPEGCKDIDDAMHFKKLDDGFEVGIHIADPESWLHNKGIPIYEKARLLTSTLYTPFGNFHMLPNKMATDLCSLLEGKERRATSLILTFDIDKNLIDYHFEKSIVINKKNYTYENFTIDKIPKEHNNFYEFVKKLYHDDILDSHTFVEKLMVLANSTAAKYLAKKIPKALILRKMEKIDMVNFVEEIKLNEMINFLRSSGAEYTSINDKDKSHGMLDEELYTYFTSPIRRLLDLENHKLIGSLLLGNHEEFDEDGLKMFIDHLNHMQKMIKRTQRESLNLYLIFTLEEEGENIFEGSVVSIQENILGIYLPSKKTMMSVNIISDRFLHLFDVKKDDKTITLTKNNKTTTFTLGEKLNLKIFACKKESNFRKKLKFDILDKETIDLFSVLDY